MKIAVCDDEAVQRELLIRYLYDWAKEKKVLLTAVPFSSAESFLFEWEENKAFDLLILDIEMGYLSGMELACKIRAEDEEIPILFVTGYGRYMAQGYEVAALHYLLKPLRKEKLFHVLDRFYHRKTEGRSENKLFLQTEEGAAVLQASKIWYIEADGHKCRLYTKDNDYILHRSITSLEEELPNDMFVKCHRSYLVNILHIAALPRGGVILDDGTKLPLSRNAGKLVNAKFIKCFGNKDGNYDI